MQRLSIAGVSTRDSGAQLLEPVEHDLDAHQLREVAVHDLNRDLSVVAEVVREKNVRHSAGADLPLNHTTAPVQQKRRAPLAPAPLLRVLRDLRGLRDLRVFRSRSSR